MSPYFLLCLTLCLSVLAQNSNLCTTWCNLLKSTSCASNSFLTNSTICNNLCTSTNIPAGKTGDTSGNTLSCRITYLQKIITPNTTDPNCGYGLPGGGNVCGGYCEDYCYFQQNSVCNATYQISSSGTFYLELCQQICNASFPATGGDVDVSNSPVSISNSVQCRTYHTTAAHALNLPNVHCPHASITGGGVCGGDPCVPYCATVGATCTGSNLAFHDGTAGNCLPICQNFITNNASRTSAIWGTSGEPDADGFDDVACRAYHSGVPALVNPAVHCQHAQPLGGGVCGADYCLLYNKTYAQICNPIRTLAYPSSSTNLDYFCNLTRSTNANTMTAGIPSNFSYITDTTMDTVQCRYYHMLAGWVFNYTGSDKNGITEHCPHADEMGGNTCGTLCGVYCRVFVAVCGSNAANTYSGVSDCLSKCNGNGIPIAFNDLAQSGNSVECRIYHAYAAQSTGLLDVHCPHASLAGGGVCVGTSTSGSPSSTSGNPTPTSGNPTPTPTTGNSGIHPVISVILIICISLLQLLL